MIIGVIDSGIKIVTNGLVLWLDAAQGRSYSGSGTAWNDISGTGNNLTLTNGPTFSSNNGGVIVFDGTNDFATRTSPTSIPTNQSAKTMSVWFYTTNTSNNTQQVFTSHNNSGAGGASTQIEIRFNLNVSPQRMTIHVSNWGGNPVVVSTVTPSANTWYNVAFTTGGSGTTHRIYINGSQNATATSTLQTGNITNIFLATFSGSSEFLTGGVASALYYNRELTATEVLQNYNALKSRFGL